MLAAAEWATKGQDRDHKKDQQRMCARPAEAGYRHSPEIANEITSPIHSGTVRSPKPQGSRLSLIETKRNPDCKISRGRVGIRHQLSDTFFHVCDGSGRLPLAIVLPQQGFC